MKATRPAARRSRCSVAARTRCGGTSIGRDGIPRPRTLRSAACRLGAATHPHLAAPETRNCGRRCGRRRTRSKTPAPRARPVRRILSRSLRSTCPSVRKPRRVRPEPLRPGHLVRGQSPSSVQPRHGPRFVKRAPTRRLNSGVVDHGRRRGLVCGWRVSCGSSLAPSSPWRSRWAPRPCPASPRRWLPCGSSRRRGPRSRTRPGSRASR